MSYKTCNNPDIMDAMRDMKDIYRMAVFIDSNKYVVPAGIATPHLAMEDCARQYVAKRHGFIRHKISQTRARRTIDNAVHAGYIKVVGDNTPAHNGHKMIVCTGDGEQLITKGWLLRRGLAEQTMKRYPNTAKRYEVKYNTIMILVGVIITAAAALIAIILKSHLGVKD